MKNDKGFLFNTKSENLEKISYSTFATNKAVGLSIISRGLLCIIAFYNAVSLSDLQIN